MIPKELGPRDPELIRPELVKRLIEELTGVSLDLSRRVGRGGKRATSENFEVDRMEVIPSKERTIFEARGRLHSPQEDELDAPHATKFSLHFELDRESLRRHGAKRSDETGERRLKLAFEPVHKQGPARETVHFTVNEGARGSRLEQTGRGFVAVNAN